MKNIDRDAEWASFFRSMENIDLSASPTVNPDKVISLFPCPNCGEDKTSACDECLPF